MELSELALDRRMDRGKEIFLVVEKDHPDHIKSIKYDNKNGKGERNALRWVRLATGFDKDISLMPITRLWEEKEVVKVPDIVVEETITTTSWTSEENPFTEVINNPPEELINEEKIIPFIDTYFCTKCQKNHRKTESNIGRKHLKYREVK